MYVLYARYVGHFVRRKSCKGSIRYLFPATRSVHALVIVLLFNTLKILISSLAMYLFIYSSELNQFNALDILKYACTYVLYS